MDLEPGEVICTECEGKGFYKTNDPVIYLECQKCFGYGKLNWIENITGKKDYI